MAGRRVVIEFLGEDKSLSKTTGKVDRETSKLGKTLSAVGKTAALGLAGGVAAGTVALVGMAKGAAEDEKAQKVLAVTLKNAAKATDDQVASVEAYISKTGLATGITDDQMRPALANLVRATKDVGKAQSLMNLAMDVSAGTGKDLGAITMALAKAQNGSTAGLSKLGIATKDASGKALSFEAIQKNLAKTFTGQAAASAGTLEGKFARLKLAFAETQEEIGAKLIPVATRLADWVLKTGIPAISSFAGWVGKNKDVLKPLAIGLGAVTVAVWALNLAMSANPISLVVIGIAALATGLVIAYKRSETFRNIVNTAFAVVRDVIGDVITVGTAVVKFFKDLPGNISRAFGDAKQWLVAKGRALASGLFSGVVAYLRSIRSAGAWFYKNVISPTVSSFAAAGSWLVSAGKNVIIGLIKGYVAYLRFIGGVGVWLYKNVVSPIIRLFANGATWLVAGGRMIISGLISGLLAYLRAIGGAGAWVYRNTVTPIVSLFTSASVWLVASGKNIITGFLSGIAANMKGVGSWLKRVVVDPIINAVKAFFGIKSPSKVFEGIGGHLVSGLFKGLSSANVGGMIEHVFGGMPAALSSIVNKGLLSIGQLPGKALNALGNIQEGILPQGINNMPGGFQKMLFRGKLLNRDTVARIQAAEAMLGGGQKFQITQGSYSNSVKASGTTHSGGGVFDSNGPGGWSRAVNALRNVGFAAWHRTPSQGPWGNHIHAVALQDPTKSPAASRQAKDFLAGGDGLAGYRQGTPWVPNDQLAFLHKGEGVIPAEVNKARMRGAGGGFLGTVRVELALDGKVIQTKLLKLKSDNGGLALGLS